MRRVSSRSHAGGHVHPRRAQFSHLGLGLLVLGAAGVVHTRWGVAVDPVLLAAGAIGLLWALYARHAAGFVAGVVLLGVALAAFLEDRQSITGPIDIVVLLCLALVLLLAGGLPATWSEARPIAPAGALVLLAVYAALRLAAAWAAAPWDLCAPVAVLLGGLALLAWDARGGQVP
jgi:hypothetical protein